MGGGVESWIYVDEFSVPVLGFIQSALLAGDVAKDSAPKLCRDCEGCAGERRTLDIQILRSTGRAGTT